MSRCKCGDFDYNPADSRRSKCHTRAGHHCHRGSLVVQVVIAAPVTFEQSISESYGVSKVDSTCRFRL